MRWLVCGGRDYGDLPMRPMGGGLDKNHPDFDERFRQAKKVLATLTILSEKYSANYIPDDNRLPSDIEIISGMARGVDTLAVDWAINNWCKWHEFPADWEANGTAAGPIRNQKMLDEGKPDLVIAFPGGSGTADMVRRAKAAGVKVVEIT